MAVQNSDAIRIEGEALPVFELDKSLGNLRRECAVSYVYIYTKLTPRERSQFCNIILQGPFAI